MLLSSSRFISALLCVSASNKSYREFVILHLLLHALVPLLVATLFFGQCWRRSYFIMMATMIVDSDHLLASPIYDSNRCSIGFHPLHTVIPIIVYALLCLFPKTRLLGLGLVIHMLLDWADCW